MNGASVACKRTQLRRSGTKWARYEVRPMCLQAEHISQHVHTEAHKVATFAHFSPDAPVRLLLQKSLADDQLLAGAVPQPADWLRAWRCCMDPMSWESAGKHAFTEHYIAQIRPRAVAPKSFKAMVSCMAEVLRQDKRECLRAATTIFLGFDDKNGRKLLLFKADLPKAPPCLDAGGQPCLDAGSTRTFAYGARWGVVGCLPCDGGAEGHPRLDDWERDYAERTSAEVVKLLRSLCAPEGEAVDEALMNGILRKVRGLVVDGALLKTCQVLRSGPMPNVALVIRDPAHVIRTTCRDPLHDAALFSAQYERLFQGRHAILKDIHNSKKLKEQLEAAQRELLAAGGLGGGLQHALRHMCFAQQRFESFVVPRRRYVCLIHAVALVLVLRAGDMRRDASERKSAQTTLDAMTGADCFVAGLAGDYGEVCLEFLRQFDVTDHDPACTPGEVSTFIARLRRLFVQGYVICAPTPDNPGRDGGAPKTLSEIALDAVKDPLVLTCPAVRVVRLRACARVSERMRACVRAKVRQVAHTHRQPHTHTKRHTDTQTHRRTHTHTRNSTCTQKCTCASASSRTRKRNTHEYKRGRSR